MEEQKITLGKTTGKLIKIPCIQCDQKTNHQVLSSVYSIWNDRDISWDSHFEIVKCMGCDFISFRSASTFSEDIETDPDTGEAIYPITEELYPNRIMGKRAMKEAYLLPYPLAPIYKEVYDAMCRNSRILASTGIRILVEAICKAEGAKGADLEKKIDDLVKRGILTADNAETLHSTRLLGNRSAHEGEQSTAEEIGVAMDIVENLMHRVYVIPVKASKLPHRKISK
ncbi:MAG: DUF4145 domain-containing protein [Candidatus Moraniibacteriota bacterium]|nr:MAG: DUF4145 domain-containing protein [Candidatus Moranbacteria bacterium]